MDEDTADLLRAARDELAYWLSGQDVEVGHLDTTDSEVLLDDITQAVYEYDCSKFDVIDGRPKPLVLKGRI